MANRRHHRVLIQVTDDEIADEALGTAMATMLRPNKLRFKTDTFSCIPSQHYRADIDVQNYNTLSLTKSNRQGVCMSEVMNFDCVGRTITDPLIRNELSTLFDVLLVDQQNCAMVHFRPMRDRPTNFFNDTLVPEVDKRLSLLRGTWMLQYIKLEYYDVQKYDVVNMFQKSRGIMDASRNELIFHNTGEFLHWTHRAYMNLWANGAEHESFEFEFVFVEEPNEIIDMGAPVFKTSKCKLSIQFFYLSKIDGNMRVGLQSFFENMHQNNTNKSILTDYLREYFLNQNEPWTMWMLFDVPQVNYGSSIVNDMLTLAQTAYSTINNFAYLKRKDMNMGFATQDNKTQIMRQLAGRNTPVTRQKPRNSAKIPKTATYNKVPSVKMSNYSYNFWYSRIEENFANVINAMDRYYDRKYNAKIQTICHDLKNTTRNIDNDISLKSLDLIERDDQNGESDETLENLLKKYREALSDYRLLIQKIDRSKYADQLKALITSKNIEINNHTRQMKIRLLEICKGKLLNVIKDEVKTLNGESINANVNLTSFTPKPAVFK